MREKIFDWRGNEVKPGMTIYFVQKSPGILGSSRYGILIPQTGEIVREDEINWQKRKNQEIWELGQEWLVVENNNRLCVQCCDGEMTVTIPFNQFGDEKEQTIAIKGISDKK